MNPGGAIALLALGGLAVIVSVSNKANNTAEPSPPLELPPHSTPEDLEALSEQELIELISVTESALGSDGSLTNMVIQNDYSTFEEKAFELLDVVLASSPDDRPVLEEAYHTLMNAIQVYQLKTLPEEYKSPGQPTEEPESGTQDPNTALLERVWGEDEAALIQTAIQEGDLAVIESYVKKTYEKYDATQDPYAANVYQYLFEELKKVNG